MQRRRQILEAARERADAEGWAAVTTRHLAAAIGFTQPVLYGHFPGGKAEIMLAVASEGFVELAGRGRAALAGAEAGSAHRVEAVGTAYLDFAAEHPAVYEAMFQQPLDAEFASEDTPDELRDGFEVLRSALADESGGTVTEVFWGALHGLSLLERAGRLRPEQRAERVLELARRFSVGDLRAGRRAPGSAVLDVSTMAEGDDDEQA